MITLYFVLLSLWVILVLASHSTGLPEWQKAANVSSYLFFWVGTPVAIYVFGYLGSWVLPAAFVVQVSLLYLVESISPSVYGKVK